MKPNGLQMFLRYLGERFRRRLTWITALIVGTLINLYGQLLVPWLRDIEDPTSVFVRHLEEHPGECILSVVVAYLFPLCVSASAAAIALYQDRDVHSRAQFPDQKPDPVFRALRDGNIVDAGEPTRRLFEKCGVRRAQDVLGDDVWGRVLAATAAPGRPPFRTEIAAHRIPGRYLLAHSVAPTGGINIYLAQLHEDALPT